MKPKEFLDVLSEDIDEIIEQRSSWRTYIEKNLEANIREDIESFMKKVNSGPFGTKARFQLLDVPDTSWSEKRKFGTYGFIRGARHFIAGVIEKGKFATEEFGYLMEEIILYATKLGLGTCWIGGTFKRGEFATMVDLKPSESLPAVSPIGYIPEDRRFIGKIMRWTVKAKKRKPWEELFYQQNFGKPLPESTEIKYKKALRMVQLGPSAKNKQPWRLVLDSDEKIVHFFVKKEEESEESRVKNFQKLDLGIAMCHFDLSCASIGLNGKFKYEPSLIDVDRSKYAYIMSWFEN